MAEYGSRLESRRLGLLFTVVATGLFVQSVDATIVATAFEAMRAGFGSSIGWVSWSLTGYSFGMVVALPVSAQLVRRFGARITFLTSTMLFGLVSALCGAAPAIGLLIVLRVFQGFAGAGLTPAGTALIVNNFGKNRDRAIGFFGSLFQAGTIAGPIFGGLFVQFVSWRWIFYVNFPLCMMLFVAGYMIIPRESHGSTIVARSGVDWRGISLLSGGLIVGMLAVSLLGDGTLHHGSLVAALLVAAAALLFIFYRHVAKIPSPYISPRLITGRGFGAVNVINIVYGGANVGFLSLLPFYAETRYETSPLASGAVLTASAVGGLIFGFVGVLFLRRTGYRWPLFANAILAGVSWILISYAPPDSVHPFMWLACLAAVVGLGRGGSDPAARNAGIQLLPSEAASIAALRTMGRRIGTILAVSLATAYIAAADDQLTAQAHTFFVFGVLLFVCTIAIVRVPEQKGAW